MQLMPKLWVHVWRRSRMACVLHMAVVVGRRAEVLLDLVTAT